MWLTKVFRVKRRTLGFVGALCLLALTAAGPAQADWTTYHADPALTGVDMTSGTALPFATAWTAGNLAGDIWSEPLVYNGVVIVATEDNDLYAFDEATGAQVWHVNAGAPVSASELPCGDITPTVGITSTPVIDAGTGTLYAVADVGSGSSAVHTLFAYNAATGSLEWSRSVEPPGDDPLNQLQRESLTLDGGRVLIGYGGNDGDCAQYTGFLISAPENDQGANDVYTVPTTREGAIWSGGGAPAVDANGNVYVATGNAASGPGQPYDHGDTVEKLSAEATELDYWAPLSWAQDSAGDADLGSVSPAILPGNLAFQGGKNGNGYLISTADLGHISAGLYSAPVCNSFGSDAYANGVLYVACSGGIKALNIVTSPPSFNVRWSGPSDANGPPIIAGGLVWVTSTTDAKLYGLNPLTGGVMVSTSTPAMEHFITPSATNGKLFLATDTTLNAYTIATGSTTTPTPTPAPIPTPVSIPTPTPATTSRCSRAVVLRFGRRRHERIVRATVYEGQRRLATRRGSRLRSIAVRHVARGGVAIRLVEVSRHGHRIIVIVRVRGCRRVGH